MAELRSFVSEHTTEYALVTAAVNAFASQNQRVTPFFFWRSREGSKVGLKSGPGGPVQMLAIYPRRPKVLGPGQNWITVKFNHLLFEHSQELARAGICTLAGVPCVSSLADFATDVTCAWFLLDPNAIPADRFVDLTLGPEPRASATEDGIMGPLAGSALPSLAAARCRVTSWPNLVSAIREVGKTQRAIGFYRGHWFAPYKPFYLLLHSAS